MRELYDFSFYSRHFLKILTKTDGKRPFVLRHYQAKWVNFVNSIKGPRRIIVVKPRQAGFSTLVAAYFFQRMNLCKNFTGLGMADVYKRTQAIRSIYTHYFYHLPPSLRPMFDKDSEKELSFQNPDKNAMETFPGLQSGIKFETAQDPNAGRSEPRKFAHLSENAFYPHYTSIDDGIQNSIPIVDGTFVVKESTANGRAGVGKPFYLLYNAAKRGESLYKSFFVAWYEVDDYTQMAPRNVQLSKYEKEILKMHKGLTIGNLMWRRNKILEYLNDEEECYLTPQERFKQDFPLSDTEAFLHTGLPVFPNDKVDALIQNLSNFRPQNIKNRLQINDHMIKQFWEGLEIYSPPRKGKFYIIGADVAEGLASGDASSAFIMDEAYTQVARWHGKIDADLYGHLLISLGMFYNNALLVVENNNMGHTTITTIKNQGYPRQYRKEIEDRITKQKRIEFGWKTTGPSKNDMVNEGIARLRDDTVRILDVALPTQMSTVTRGENGIVELNGKDRVVAYCLALMGRRHYSTLINVSTKPIEGKKKLSEHEKWENQNKVKKSDDLFD